MRQFKQTPIIEIHQVAAFRKDRRVFSDLSVTIAAGENVAILGPNGSGKSTLLQLISRDLYPVVGAGSYVRLYGSERVNLWDLRQRIGLVSQDLQSDYTPYATGLEVVLSGFFGAVGAHTHLQPTSEQVRRAEATMDGLGIADLHNRMFQRMSTGQQRRCLLGRALIHQPQTLILDEPTSGLDLGASLQFLHTMRGLCQEGRNVLIATHHVEEIVPEVERVILLREGRIVADGEKAVILTSATISDLYGFPVEVVERQGWYRAYAAV